MVSVPSVAANKHVQDKLHFVRFEMCNIAIIITAHGHSEDQIG